MILESKRVINKKYIAWAILFLHSIAKDARWMVMDI